MKFSMKISDDLYVSSDIYDLSSVEFLTLTKALRLMVENEDEPDEVRKTASLMRKEILRKDDESDHRMAVYDFLKEKLGDIVDDREELKAWFERMVWHVKECDRLAHQDIIQACVLESATREAYEEGYAKGMADRPTGEWLDNSAPANLQKEWVCSRCGSAVFYKTNYCERCGAEMIDEDIKCSKCEHHDKYGYDEPCRSCR